MLKVYRGKRVLVTGHTGFKGSWLCEMLSQLGAEVYGYSLAPINQSLYNFHQPKQESIADICDREQLNTVMNLFQPQLVFHLAAQALVRDSYQNPIETWSTNVMGTAHLLDSIQFSPSCAGVLVITTDKCYKNNELGHAFKESDALGGHDPYSSSKAATEILCESWRLSFWNQKLESPLLATARAGNVIGGGDFSKDRLLPDLIRSIQKDTSLEVRMPHATRPWQHVMDALFGYLLLGEKILLKQQEYARAWNFGPQDSECRTVAEVLTIAQGIWSKVQWHIGPEPNLHEAQLLQLNSTEAYNKLNWKPQWNTEQALQKTVEWYQHWLRTGESIAHDQIKEYFGL